MRRAMIALLAEEALWKSCLQAYHDAFLSNEFCACSFARRVI
jgi:hypothetical protein